MELAENRQVLHHALKVKAEACTGCSHCMRVCPTCAIRVRSGKAVIEEAKCIDCGECYRACPVSAIFVEQDDLRHIFRFNHRIALIPASFLGQFDEAYPRELILGALIQLGFTDVFEIEKCVPAVYNEQEQWLSENQRKGVHISAFCPAIVRLIQVKFPLLTKQLILVKPPVDAAALYCREKMKEKGQLSGDTGIFYITPCAAKIAAVKSPVGEETSPIDGVINMYAVYNKVHKILNQHADPAPFCSPYPALSSFETRWCLTRGETSKRTGPALAVDGVHHVIEFLEKLEDDDTGLNLFLELRACEKGCAGGILVSGNRFLIHERLYKPKRTQIASTETQPSFSLDLLKPVRMRLEPIAPRSSLALDSDTAKALKKLEKVRRLMCFLPGFDCSACGAPSCQALAEDVVNRKAHLSDCAFIQRLMEKHHTLSPEHSLAIIGKIWGNGRLEKNCNKTGANHENF